MNSRPMPATLYTGPIISLKPRPIVSHPKFSASGPVQTGTTLQRRPHTRRISSALLSGLAPVSEEEEVEVVENDPPPSLLKSRRRPRPAPLIPPCGSYRPDLPILSETPDSTVSFQEERQRTGFALSPSTLLDRRPSETLFDFPVPPTSLFIESAHASSAHSHHTPSPTSSNESSSSCYPRTPQHSHDESYEDFVTRWPVKACNVSDEGPSINDAANITFLDLDDYLPIEFHRFRRTASSMSLRSFAIAELDTQSHLTHPNSKRAARIPKGSPTVAKEIQALRDKPLEVDENWIDLSEEGNGRLLSVVDTVSGSSFDVPLVLGSFLPSSTDLSDAEDTNSDREDILDVLIREGEDENVSIGTPLSSSDEEDSDIELFGPSRVLDPVLSAASSRRRRRPTRPKRPDTPSIYSMASFSESAPRFASSFQQSPQNLSPTVVHRSHHSDFPHSPISPSPCNSPLQPELRSRFSSSTLGSISEPTSTTSFFFTRLIAGNGRNKRSSSRRTSSKASTTTGRPPSPYISDTNTNSHTMRKASYTSTSPTPSSFSFSSRSSSDRERDYADDTSSCFSGDSAGSNGLKRPPIPIELFIRA